MFDTLLASDLASPARVRPAAGAVLLHLIIVLAALRATAAGPAAPTAVRDTIRLDLKFTPATPRPSPAPPESRELAPAPPIAPAFPPQVPSLELRPLNSDIVDLDPRALVGATALHDSGGTTERSEQPAYSTTDVDQPPELAAGLSPVYPEALRHTGLSGTVVLEYVVSLKGRVQPGSVRIIRSTHPAFAAAAIDALAKARFNPAHRSGRPVSVLVQQTIRFAFLPKSGRGIT